VVTYIVDFSDFVFKFWQIDNVYLLTGSTCCRLADKGHTVVGVDCSPLAIESFFNEHSLEFTKEPVSKLNGFLYKVSTT